jgi:Lrp/AsnC family leucine-responsive transcriptional regulator
MIDPIDLQILDLLQENARMSNAEIARRIGMAPSGTFERLRRLEERGVIRGYSPRLDAKAVGLGLLAFIFVRAEELPGETVTGEALAEIPEVLEVHHVAGEDCYLAKARVAGTDELGRLLRERFGAIPSVRSTRTTIVLDTVKEQVRLPLAPDAASAAEGG